MSVPSSILLLLQMSTPYFIIIVTDYLFWKGERERETFYPQLCYVRIKQGTRSGCPTQVQEHKDLDHHLLPPRYISRKLERKWRSNWIPVYYAALHDTCPSKCIIFLKPKNNCSKSLQLFNKIQERSSNLGRNRQAGGRTQTNDKHKQFFVFYCCHS